MPRPSRSRHPVRVIRTIIGKTQAQFAELIGVSTIALKRIENGTLKLSPVLASRIKGATGASRVELLKGRRGKALGWHQQPYTTDTYEIWTRQWDAREKKSAQSNLLKYMRLVIAAAAQSKDVRPQAVFVALADAIDRVTEEFHLDKVVVKLWSEQATTRVPLSDGRGDYTRTDLSLWSMIEPASRRSGQVKLWLTFDL